MLIFLLMAGISRLDTFLGGLDTALAADSMPSRVIFRMLREHHRALWRKHVNNIIQRPTSPRFGYYIVFNAEKLHGFPGDMFVGRLDG